MTRIQKRRYKSGHTTEEDLAHYKEVKREWYAVYKKKLKARRVVK